MGCDLDIDQTGDGCGTPAVYGVGIVNPITDKYTRVALSCGDCLLRLVNETDHWFRRMDLDMAVRIRKRRQLRASATT